MKNELHYENRTVARAKELTDDVVENMPEVVAARKAEADALKRMLDEQNRMPRVDAKAAEDLIADIDSRIRNSGTARNQAAFDDLMAGDLTFAHAIRIADDLDRLGRIREAAQCALQGIERRIQDFAEPAQIARGAFSAAKRATAETIWRAKLAYADANPPHKQA